MRGIGQRSVHSTVRRGAGKGAGGADPQTPRMSDTADAQEQGATFARRQVAVAKHHPGAGRQRQQRRDERIADPLVGHQPGVAAGREIAVQIGHCAAIATRMTQASPSQPLSTIAAGIADAAALAGRPPAAVTLIAVSKTHPAEAIVPLLAAGQRVFGENRVAEAATKWPALRADYPDVTLHLIGQLQSNKADEAVALFDAIHSVDRPSLVEAIARAMTNSGRRPACFIQVNIGDEPQKGGCAIGEVAGLLDVARRAGLPVAGLMCIPPADVEPAPYFALLAKIARELELEGLSMGMSADYETAVTLGATHVRVGSALFGAREVPQA